MGTHIFLGRINWWWGVKETIHDEVVIMRSMPGPCRVVASTVCNDHLAVDYSAYIMVFYHR